MIVVGLQSALTLPDSCINHARALSEHSQIDCSNSCQRLTLTCIVCSSQ